jgi:hypothetical protein
MSRMSGDAIDECCEEIKGHHNWAHFDTLSAKDKKKALAGEMVIVFWNEPGEEEDAEER